MANIATPAPNTRSANTPQNAAKNTPNMLDEISKEAYKLFLERGGHDGFDQDDWHRAVKIVKSRR